MQFSLEQLAAFVAVFEKGSFSEAAAKLGKHRTTIGQVVTNLEDQLAIELFERIGRSAKPTEDGQLLYRYAKQTIEQASSFDKIALSLSFGQQEEITIGYCSFIPNEALVRIRIRLLNAFPNMKVNFVIKNKDEVKQGLINNEIQVGIVNVDTRTAMTSFDTSVVAHASFALYAATSSELQSYPANRLYNKLKTSKQLILSAYLEDNLGDKITLSPDVEVIDDLSLLMNLVQQDVGWALLPRVNVIHLTEVLQISELEIDEMKDYFRFPVSLWLPHSKPMLEVKKHIAAVINEFVGELKA
ncbi:MULTISPECIES: LysR family transcriptional regulator [unclassified Agarivorans]|uniref:LysR family transcriptional regulator n=1 Tax=unclassified Agarivorans TaxID=2636026 RepID=UPI0026E13B18|nr:MULTISPECIES: LysR family transcriptional regulator [unclassified Agarivorans]MDO6686052.1 LysR family transcriptional regulator [Agarivorans sp. 3_MG-2023]MDO6713810.1 LysR family transcriptional regulator [Agarivorans sp. 2_MG-2023]